jgi:hypothetical protein
MIGPAKSEPGSSAGLRLGVRKGLAVRFTQVVSIWLRAHVQAMQEPRPTKLAPAHPSQLILALS